MALTHCPAQVCTGSSAHTLRYYSNPTPVRAFPLHRSAGDFADEINADVVVLSSEAVHAKHVDANQLAEFVSCPVLLLP